MGVIVNMKKVLYVKLTIDAPAEDFKDITDDDINAWFHDECNIEGTNAHLRMELVHNEMWIRGAMLRDKARKLSKAEHDRDRYKERIAWLDREYAERVQELKEQVKSLTDDCYAAEWGHGAAEFELEKRQQRIVELEKKVKELELKNKNMKTDYEDALQSNRFYYDQLLHHFDDYKRKVADVLNSKHYCYRTVNGMYGLFVDLSAIKSLLDETQNMVDIVDENSPVKMNTYSITREELKR